MMTDQQMAEIASRVLRGRPPTADLKDVEVHSDLDYDGGSILRVTARYERAPDPKEGFVEAIHALRSAFLDMGDDRFVFLTNEVDDGRQRDEDLD